MKYPECVQEVSLMLLFKEWGIYIVKVVLYMVLTMCMDMWDGCRCFIHVLE